jgi:hypothetical protein
VLISTVKDANVVTLNAKKITVIALVWALFASKDCAHVKIATICWRKKIAYKPAQKLRQMPQIHKEYVILRRASA